MLRSRDLITSHQGPPPQRHHTGPSFGHKPHPTTAQDGDSCWVTPESSVTSELGPGQAQALRSSLREGGGSLEPSTLAWARGSSGGGEAGRGSVPRLGSQVPSRGAAAITPGTGVSRSHGSSSGAGGCGQTTRAGILFVCCLAEAGFELVALRPQRLAWGPWSPRRLLSSWPPRPARDGCPGHLRFLVVLGTEPRPRAARQALCAEPAPALAGHQKGQRCWG